MYRNHDGLPIDDPSLPPGVRQADLDDRHFSFGFADEAGHSTSLMAGGPSADPGDSTSLIAGDDHPELSDAEHEALGAEQSARIVDYLADGYAKLAAKHGGVLNDAGHAGWDRLIAAVNE